jgi:polyisoprenoid-binding protein YceI
MMISRLLLACSLGCAMLTLGCADAQPVSEVVANDSAAAPIDSAAKAPAAPNAEAPASPAAEPTAGKKIELTPKNTSIEFTGIHTGDKPDPRHGRFQQFTGTAVVNGGLKSVVVNIETASLTTEIEKLTNHLKNADFFNVNQFPTASFHSTSIKETGEGMVEITGDLKLLDTTNSITFPAKVGTEGGLTLNAEFKIDRTKWGMNYGVDNVEKEVPMKITVGG